MREDEREWNIGFGKVEISTGIHWRTVSMEGQEHKPNYVATTERE